MEQQYIAQTKDDAVSPLWFTLPTQEQIEKARAIQTVGDLLDFIENNKKLFCVNGRLEAKAYFSRYDRDKKIDDIKDIPQRFVFDWCAIFKGDDKIVDRFSNYFYYPILKTRLREPRQRNWKSRYTIPTQYQIERAKKIQTVGELLDFLEDDYHNHNYSLFDVHGRLEAKAYFSRYDRGKKIDDIKRIPQRFVFDWCMTFRTDTDIIIRFRSRIRTRRWIELWNFHFPDYRIKQNDGA